MRTLLKSIPKSLICCFNISFNFLIVSDLYCLNQGKNNISDLESLLNNFVISGELKINVRLWKLDSNNKNRFWAYLSHVHVIIKKFFRDHKKERSLYSSNIKKLETFIEQCQREGDLWVVVGWGILYGLAYC